VSLALVSEGLTWSCPPTLGWRGPRRTTTSAWPPFLTRAAENFIYLVVAMRGHCSIASRHGGKILPHEMNPMGWPSRISPHSAVGGRRRLSTPSALKRKSMRGRLFPARGFPGPTASPHRSGSAFLAKVPSNVTLEMPSASRHRADHRRGTVPEAEAQLAGGQDRRAIRLFERLCGHVARLDRPGRT